MAKYVVEFSPPEKHKLESYEYDVTDSVLNYRIVLAPFQKQTQVEFSNVKLKETAVRFLTVVNPLDKPGQFILPSPSDGVYFNIYKFDLKPNSECELAITWQPSEYGNMRKLIKIEQLNSNRKYDFVILGSCNSPPYKKFKSNTSTYSKINNSKMIKKQMDCCQQNITSSKTKIISCCKTDKVTLIDNLSKTPEPIRRQTYSVREKENLPVSKNKILCRDTILTSPERSVKRPDQKCQDQYFNKHFNFNKLNKSSSPMSDDGNDLDLDHDLEFKIIITDSSQLDNFNLTPLQSTENLFSTPSTKKLHKQLNFDVTDESLTSPSTNVFQLKSEDAINVTFTYTPLNNKLTYVSSDYYNQFVKSPEDELNKTFSTIGSDSINLESYNAPLPEVVQSSCFNPKQNMKDLHIAQSSTMVTCCNTTSSSQSLAVKNSPYYKCSPITMAYEDKLIQCKTSLQTTRSKASKQDKCDQNLKSLTSPELWYHNYVEDPFLKMSQYYEREWLNRQESDMIRWINALLTPTDKLVDEEQSGDLEQATLAWIKASRTNNEHKPMEFATQKDLFAAQIYRQSPQQWKALRKASTNLFTSTSVAPVLSKLTLLIEKDLITVRDDRQIHLDLSLKKKIIDLLKCYNPLWLRIGLEAIYGQIVNVKHGSNDLDGVGWFVRKNLFHNDFVKQKFTKTSVLQVNLPMFNTTMKKFILRKIFMLFYFLDCAKEHQLIRHNPCLFKVDSPYKSSYDILMGFCADMVAAHGDIFRRLRSIGYNLNHKQTHLDEVNYAVKSLNDLRDGIRITRVVEILFKGSPLSPKLRLPAISKLQKIHNVNLAFNRILEHISIEGNINSRDIVSGHREKILSLFWQIIYKYLTPRYNYAATKIQIWWRNNSLKLVILKRICLKKITKRNLAATKIQALVRGYLMRKQWPHIHSELIKNREMLHAASTKIKLYLKYKLKFLTNERKHLIILKRTVLMIQKKFRAKIMMVKERQNYLKLKQSALIIQKHIRGFIVRKNWPQIKKSMIVEKEIKIAAVNVVKRVLRRNLPLTKERIEYLKLLKSTIYVQRLFIAKRAMKLQFEYYTVLKKTTVFLQQKFRANFVMQKERKKFLEAKRCVVLIQKAFRGYMVRKNWPDLHDRLVFNKKKRVSAINTVKRALRLNLPLTQDRLNFLKLKNIVIYIEKLYLANKLMNTQVKYYFALRNATVFIQRQFRANLIMKREQHTYLNIRRSVLLIQKVFRGFIVRKYWPNTKICLISEKKKLINAINIVKRALRRQLPVTQDRVNFIKLKNVVLFVQKTWRANRLMKIQNEYHYATVFVQRKFRANMFMQLERYNYLKAKKSALVIQKVYRGYEVRKKWSSIKMHLMSNKIKRAHAANKIKHILRQNLPPTQDRLYYEQLRQSSLIIQRRFRANVVMRAQRNKYRMLKISTVLLQSHIRGLLVRRQWPQLKERLLADQKFVLETQQEKNIAASKIQAAVRGFLTRKRFSVLKNQQLREIRLNAATKVQSLWRGYCVRKKYQCRRAQLSIEGNLTLGKRHDNILDALNKQKRKEYSYKELSTVFWNLDTCTSLSKELCVKTANSVIVDHIFRFFQYSNQSQPSIEAREPAIRVLNNLLRYHETSLLIWTRTVNSGMVSELIKMMKTSCGKLGTTNKLYCLIATWMWIALQDPKKKQYIENVPNAIAHFKFMTNILDRKYSTHKMDKKTTMVLPSTKPTWLIGSKCQKSFENDLFATWQICKILKIT